MIHNKNEAVSIISSVLLLLIIVMALVAVVYFYTNEVIGDQLPRSDIYVRFQMNDKKNKLMVLGTNVLTIKWADLKVTAADGSTLTDMINDIVSTSFDPLTDFVRAEDCIEITCEKTTVTVVYAPTNRLLGMWAFSPDIIHYPCQANRI